MCALFGYRKSDIQCRSFPGACQESEEHNVVEGMQGIKTSGGVLNNT